MRDAAQQIQVSLAGGEDRLLPTGISQIFTGIFQRGAGAAPNRRYGPSQPLARYMNTSSNAGSPGSIAGTAMLAASSA